MVRLDAPRGESSGSNPIAYVNGKRHNLPPGAAERSLLQYLRGEPLSYLAFPENRVQPACKALSQSLS